MSEKEKEKVEALQDLLNLPDEDPISEWDNPMKVELRRKVRLVLNTGLRTYSPIEDKELEKLQKQMGEERKKLLASEPAFSIPGWKFQLKRDGSLHKDDDSTASLSTRVFQSLLNEYKRIQLCQRKECNTLFIRIKRQRYCSERCGNFVRVNRHRRKKKGSEKADGS